MNCDIVNNIITCFKISRSDGITLGFTDSQDDVVLDGLTYYSSSVIHRSAIESSSDISPDNLEITGILDHQVICQIDIIEGRYDGATIEISLFDRATGSKTKLKNGIIGAIKTDKGLFIAEVHTIIEAFEKNIGQVYSCMCRANLGDARCAVNLADFTSDGVIKEYDGSRLTYDLIDKPNGYFTSGFLIFDDFPKKHHIYRHFGKIFIIDRGLTLKKGMKFKAFPGCDKSLSSCCSKFNNAINFQAEPYILS